MRYHSLLLNLVLAGGIYGGSASGAALADDENFQYAVVLMSERGEFAAAAEKFADFAAANPQNAQAPSALFYLANCYGKLQKEQTAAETYEKLFRLYPQDKLAEQALAFSADAYFRANLYPRAVELYAVLLQKYPASSFAATARYWRAEGYTRMFTGGGSKNLEWYRAAQADFAAFLAAENQFTADALYSAGVLAFDQREYAVAAPYLARLRQEYPDYGRAEDAWYHLAESYYWQDNFIAAAAAYRELEKTFPTGKYRADALNGRGWCAYMQKDFPNAAALFAAAAPLYTDASKTAAAHFDAGAAFEEAGEPLAAIKHFAQVPSDHSRYVAAQIRQGVLTHQRAADKPELLRAAETFFAAALSAVGIEPAGAEAAAFLGEIRAALQDYDGAVAALQLGLQKWGDSRFAAFSWYHLALAQIQQQKYADAGIALNNLVTKFPDSNLRLSAMYVLADNERAQKNFVGAAAAWLWLADHGNEWAAAHPETQSQATELAARALFNLGEMSYNATLAGADEAAAATRYFKRLQAEYGADGHNAMAQIRLGELAEKQRDYPRAAAAYQNALMVVNRQPASEEMSIVKLHSEYRLSVIAVLAASQLSDPQAKTAAMTAAVKKITEFRAATENQAAAVTWRHRALYYAAEAEYALKQKTAAARDYRACYAAAPADTLADAALFGYAWVMNEDGAAAAPTLAAESWRTLLADFPKSEYRLETLYLLAVYEEAAANYAVALSLIEQLRQLAPTDDRAVVETAKIYDATGKSAEAEKLLTPFLTAAPEKPERARALHALSWACWHQAEPLFTAAATRENALKDFLQGKKLRELDEPRQAQAVKLRGEWLAALSTAREVENRMTAALEKLVADYPDFSGRGSAWLRLGETAYERGDLTPAQNYYAQVVKTGETALLDKAHYRLGWSALRLSEKSAGAAKGELRRTAVAEFTRVSKDFAASPLAGESAWQAAEILRADREYAAAAPLYRAVQNLPAGAEIKIGALYEYADCLLELKKYRDAYEAYKQFLAAKTGEQLWAPEANWGAGYAALMLGAYNEARDYFMSAKDHNYGGEAAAKARYGLGLIEFEQKNWKIAREEFRKVEVFHSGWAEVSAMALLKAAAASHELGEDEVAGKDLQRVLEKYQATTVAPQARELLAELQNHP